MNLTKNFFIFVALVTLTNALTPVNWLASEQFDQQKLANINDSKAVGGEIDAGQCSLPEFTKYLPNDGRYTVETHFTKTDHGYILQMFRVHLNAAELAKLSDKLQANIHKPILIQHGLTGDSTSMVLNQKTTFSFYLIEKGFDVWFGNNRGSKFSLDYTNENVSEREYFDYSFTEMGQYDVPAFYRQILKQYPDDPNKQIIYFGHSEGTSQMFVALSDPKSKIYVRAHTALYFALSPIAYMTQITEKIWEWLSKMEEVIDITSKLLHVWEIGALDCDDHSPEWTSVSYVSCKKLNFLCDRSDLSVDIVSGNASEAADLSESGASSKQYNHYAQLMKGGENDKAIFRPVDYGSTENMNVYGQTPPPEWDFSDWTTPTNLVIGADDHLGTVANVDVLIGKLPKTQNLTSTVIKGWAHSTVLKPKDPKPIIDIINKALDLE